ncbi:MAG TPA: hypothetical protein VK445_02705 [Dissulfurispiraceae bacterium]|nr:hypothetical protein [Dissulfurispiraceae bacterium]
MSSKKILIASVLMTALIAGGASAAHVSVNVNIGAPPPVIVSGPPSVFLIPNTPVYFAPDAREQLFFYSGFWYALHDGYWFSSTYYNGPWSYVPSPRVPAVFLHLPPRYYVPPPGHQRIPYGQLKKHWREWDRRESAHTREWEGPYQKRWRDDDADWRRSRGDDRGHGRGHDNGRGHGHDRD